MSEVTTVVSAPIEAPVMTTEVLNSSLVVPRFDASLGTLVAAELTIYGVMTSTAILQDLFGGFGTVGSGFASSFSEFSSGQNAPDFPDQSLSLIASGVTFVGPFGQAAVPLNTTNNTLTYSATDLDGATGNGRFSIDFGITGTFVGFPFGTLPQQQVLLVAEVDYYYLEPGEAVPSKTLTGNGKNNKLIGIEQNEVIEGRGGKDTLNGGRGEDLIYGGAGSDKIKGGTGHDVIKGAAGADTIFGQAGLDTIYGGDGDDSIRGGSEGDEIKGGAGRDRLYGEEGGDVILGQKGGDYIHTGKGDDGMNGGRGNDTLTGGQGTDWFFFSPKGGNDRITDFNPAEDQIHLPDFETNYAALTFTQEVSHARVRFSSDTSVLVLNTEVSELTESVFDFG